MEAVPKLTLINFELKISPENTHFGPKLRQYIAEAYREDPDTFGNEIHQLEGLRSAAVRPTNDAVGLKALNRYFCQLRAIQSRFPMGKGQPAACSFTWKDLYGNMNCTLSDIKFEMACVLYNIGALHTQLGSQESSADSIKAACQHYQHAAWSFLHLREQYPQPSGVDVSCEILKLLQEICFAQAQECILNKSIQDTRKSSVIGSVATQVLHFYKNSLAMLGPSAGTDNIHEMIGTKLYNNWHRYLSFKSSYISCIVSLYQGINAEEQQKMGERVGYYQHAVDKLSEARKLSKYIEPVQMTQDALAFINDVVEGKRKAAKNENEFIYHEEVPEIDLLVELKPVCLVKAAPIDFNDPELTGTDIFGRLVPMGAHEASSLYSEEKAKLLRHVVGQVDTKNAELIQFMSSLQLDQLDVLEEEQKIPQEIVDRCAAMNAKTDVIQTLVESMNGLAEIITDVEQMITEIRSLIQEETMLEKQYVKATGPRPPSLVQTELSREFHKYLEAHARTTDSNLVLHKACALHLANLRLLARPLDDLARHIPGLDDVEGLDRDTMREMRRVAEKAREMQRQRDALVAELRQALADDDVTRRLLAEPDAPRDQLFRDHLERHTPKVKIIEQNLSAQENILNRLTSLYAAYGESRRLLADVLRKRDAIINALTTSYDTHEELVGKTTKGLEFYRKLSHNLRALRDRLRAACQLQREERERILAVDKGSAASSRARSLESTAPTPTPPPPPPSTSGAPKLKDYLPYMKNRNVTRNHMPHQAQVEAPGDSYPEHMYPTSARPTPVGSEATEPARSSLDGATPPPNVAGMYAPHPLVYSDTSTNQYEYTTSSYTKPEEIQNYNYATVQQYATAPEQIYANPYQSPQSASRASVPPEVGAGGGPLCAGLAQLQVSGQYAHTYFSVHYPASCSDVATYSRAPHSAPTPPTATTPADPHLHQAYSNPPNVAPNFFMNASGANYNANTYETSLTSNLSTVPSVADSYGVDRRYSGAGYDNSPQSFVYPAANNSETSMPDATGTHYGVFASAVPYGTPASTAPYGTPANTAPYGTPASTAPYGIPDSVVPYGVSASTAPHGTPVSANPYGVSAETAPYGVPTNSAPYGVPTSIFSYMDGSLAQIDATDKPIKSHAKGEALGSYQGYVQPEQSYTNTGYSQSYQNHPGYMLNPATGQYDYNYGSQNSFSEVPQHSGFEPSAAEPRWGGGSLYTNAGSYDTMQSSANPPPHPQQPSEQQPAPLPAPVHYMQPCSEAPSVAYCAGEQVPASSGNTDETHAPQRDTETEHAHASHEPHDTLVSHEPYVTHEPNATLEPKATLEPHAMLESQATVVEPHATHETPNELREEPTTFDLLADIDFAVEQKPLVPDIKVPRVSEKTIVRASPAPRPVVSPPSAPVTDPPLSRPPRRDIFSDPAHLNQFTQEVKNLKTVVDTLTQRTMSGATVLDSKWEAIQDMCGKDTGKSKSVARRQPRYVATDVVPYDDSRLTLSSDPDAYVNASYYKQLGSWCIPLVISKCPDETESGTFWKAMLENQISCVVCLLSEVEMHGNYYWPTALGQSLSAGEVRVTLDDVTLCGHWTQRTLTLAHRGTAHTLTHYQINVFPAKVLCAPLLLLCDAVLRARGGAGAAGAGGAACLQCAGGAGRSALVALLLLAVCQLRAGDVRLCNTLERGAAALCAGRGGVLAEPRYLADAYRALLFYAQGVLCSGTTQFSGESVSVAASALASSAPAPVPAPPPSVSGAGVARTARESFEEMRQSAGLNTGDMKDPLNFLDPLWNLKKK